MARTRAKGTNGKRNLRIYLVPARASSGTRFVTYMLARAPADRAWRRRGWLTMCRARSRKVEVANAHQAVKDAPEQGVVKKTMMSDGGGAGGKEEVNPFAQLVATFVGLDNEDIFRHVILYL